MGRIVTIIGTRPEIIKMAPVVKALDGLDHEHVLVHSGQHYDLMMDRIFFRDMQLREPDEQFELKEQPPHLQVATTMRQVASVTKDADLVIVHGDTNTTVAGALLAKKQERRLSHVEAGIRSFDKTMPEELNRIVADQLSDVLFAPTAIWRKNLGQENVTAGVHVVGDSVIDALIQNLASADKKSDVLARLGLTRRRNMLLILHREETVDLGDRIERPRGDGPRAGTRRGPPPARRETGVAEPVRRRHDREADRATGRRVPGMTWRSASFSFVRRAPQAWNRESRKRPARWPGRDSRSTW